MGVPSHLTRPGIPYSTTNRVGGGSIHGHRLFPLLGDLAQNESSIPDPGGALGILSDPPMGWGERIPEPLHSFGFEKQICEDLAKQNKKLINIPLAKQVLRFLGQKMQTCQSLSNFAAPRVLSDKDHLHRYLLPNSLAKIMKNPTGE